MLGVLWSHMALRTLVTTVTLIFPSYMGNDIYNNVYESHSPSQFKHAHSGPQLNFIKYENMYTKFNIHGF